MIKSKSTRKSDDVENEDVESDEKTMTWKATKNDDVESDEGNNKIGSNEETTSSKAKKKL